MMNSINKQTSSLPSLSAEIIVETIKYGKAANNNNKHSEK